MRRSIAKNIVWYVSLVLLALSSGWLYPALGGSLEEGVLNELKSTDDDGNGTIILSGPGTITASSDWTSYTVQVGDTLKTGANAITLNESGGFYASLTVKKTGALVIDAGGEVNLASGKSRIINGGTIYNYNKITIAGDGVISADRGSKLYNSGTITLSGNAKLLLTPSTADMLVNTGTVTFVDATTGYSTNGNPGGINNAGGTIQIALDHGHLGKVLGDLNTADAGTIEFTSGKVGAGGFTQNGFAAGTFKFTEKQDTAEAGAIDVGAANVEFAGVGNSIVADVTAGTILVKGATTFTSTSSVAGDLDIQASTVYDTAFSGHNIAISNGATLTLDAGGDIDISNGHKLEIEAGSKIDGQGGGGEITFTDGSSLTLGVGAEITGNKINLDSLSANGLTVALYGSSSDWVGTTLFEDVVLGVNGESVISSGRYVLTVKGTDIEIAGFLAHAEYLGPLLANDMSVNITNGLSLLDAIDADAAAQALKDAVDADTTQIGNWLKTPATYNRGLRAQRQRQGEYGNAAPEALSTTTGLFNTRLLRHFDAGVDLRYGLNRFADAAPAPGGDAYASLSGRQARSRNGGYDYRPSATSVWADFHGGWAKQKEKSNINGYDYDGYGVSVGAERRIDRFLVGVAAGYTRAGVDVDDLAADYDADVMNLGVYAGYLHESGFFARAALGFAHAWNDYDVSMALGPNKKGDFDNRAYTANLDLGYVFRACAVNVVPSVGLHYTHIRQDGWRESGGQLGTVGFFGKERYNSVDVPVALRVNRVFETGCVKIAPEARAAWIYAAKKNRSEINYGLQGSGHTAAMYGVNPGRNRLQVGAGVRAQWRDRYEASLDYDYEFRSRYRNHNFSVNVGVSF